jgi:3-deoxy-manno-octulosonate cytidylyltransferase (CMP-KDO synthetase)
MIERVYKQAVRSKSLAKVVVATDRQKIVDHVVSFGGNVCLTSENHPSGTDRCYEAFALEQEPFDYIVNIQGDEPFIEPSQIDLLAAQLDGKNQLATLIKKIDSEEQLYSEGEVKVVFNKNFDALYFSRAVIPYLHKVQQKDWLNSYEYYKHVGMYAYRADVLKAITELNLSALERAESLEQLRWMENGFAIKVVITDVETMCVDTPEDLERARKVLLTN